MLQVLLSRIFSVVLRYHFAFVAVAAAMFGLVLGALLVFCCPRLFPREQVAERAAVATHREVPG